MRRKYSYKNYDRFFDKISKYESKFFEAINKAIETKNWVDIESEYYSWLKKLYKRDKCEYTSPVLLDKDLEMIKAYLITYLKIVQQKHFQPELKKNAYIKQSVNRSISMTLLMGTERSSTSF